MKNTSILICILFICTSNFLYGQGLISSLGNDTTHINHIRNHIIEIQPLINENNDLVHIKSDSMIKVLNKMGDYCLAGVFYNFKASNHALYQRYDQASIMIDSLLQISEKCINPGFLKYGAYLSMSYIESDRGNTASTDSLLNLALETAHELNDTLKIAITISNIANNDMTKNNYSDAIQHFIEADGYFKALNETQNRGGILGNIGRCYLRIENYDQAIYYCNKCIEQYPNNQYNYFLVSCLNNKASALYHTNKIEEAIDIYRYNFKLNKEGNNHLSQSYTLYGLGECMLTAGKIDSAEHYFTLSNNIDKEYELQSELISSTTALASIAKQKKNYNKANRLLTQSIKIAREYGDQKALMEALEMQLESKLESNDLGSLALKQEIDSLNDQLFNAQQINATNELLEKYERDKKDAENKFLTKENQLNESLISKQKFLIGTGLLALVTSLLFLFINYKRSSERKAHLQEVKSLNKEINHRSKNHFALATSLLSKQRTESDDENVKRALSENENRIRTFALINQRLSPTEEQSTINLKEYLSELVADLQFGYERMIDKETKVNFSCPDIMMDSEKCLRLGLITNELITNTFKHAKSDDKSLDIEISLEKNKNTLSYKYCDNGNTFTDQQKISTNNGMGLSLIQDMVQQLNGSLQQSFDEKYVFTSNFSFDR